MKLSELGSAIYLQALSASKKTADTILEHLDHRRSDWETFKLQFCLTISFLVPAAKAILASSVLSKSEKRKVHDDMVVAYFDDLHTTDPNDFVNTAEFIKDAEERNMFVNSLPDEVALSLQRSGSLGKTSLHDIASAIFNKRFTEYQDWWNSDFQRSMNAGFFPLLPKAVFTHWTGERDTTPEMFKFSLDLWKEHTIFLATLMKVLEKIDLSE